MSSGEWVDKVMVNKQDAARGVGNLFGWESEKDNVSDVLYEKYLSDSSKVYQEKSSNLFQMSNHFDITTAEDLDEFDATTSDSSEPDLLWQFNNTKLNSFPNGNGSKIQKPNAKPAKSPESRLVLVFYTWWFISYLNSNMLVNRKEGRISTILMSSTSIH